MISAHHPRRPGRPGRRPVVLLATLLFNSLAAVAAEPAYWLLSDQRLLRWDGASKQPRELERPAGSAHIHVLTTGGRERILTEGESLANLLQLAPETDAGLTRLQVTATDRPLLVAETDGARAVVVAGSRLELWDGDGTLLTAAETAQPVDAIASDGVVTWIAQGGRAERLDANLEVNASIGLPGGQSAQSLCLDAVDRQVFVATPIGVFRLPSDGDAWQPTDLRSPTSSIRCDRFGGLWALGQGSLHRLGADGRVALSQRLTNPRQPATALEPVLSLAADPSDGSAFVLTSRRLVRVDRLGAASTVRLAADSEVFLDFAVARPEPPPPPAASGSPRRQSAHPRVLPGAALAAGEMGFSGRVVFTDGTPVAGAEVTVFGRTVVRTTADANGNYATPLMPYDAAEVFVVARKQLPAGAVLGYVNLVGQDGLVSVFDMPVDFACSPGFVSGRFPTNALNGDVRAMAVFDNGSGPALYVGGTFTTAGGVTVNRVARWNGQQWSALGSGLGGGTSPSVDALAVYDDGGGARLYAGGKFTTSGSTSTPYVAKWTGSAWAKVGTGLANQVLALGVFNPGTGAQLYATGSFTTVGSTNYNRIAKWNGTAWSTVGTGLNNIGRALAVHNDGSGAKLFVGGDFTTAGGVSASRVARWSGSAWAALGSGVSGGTTIQVTSLLSHDEGATRRLLVGGRFTTAGSLTVNHVAGWNGTAWSKLGNGLASQVSGLARFDDGRGAAPWAIGSFTSVGGVTFNRLARWTGNAWEPADSGLNGAGLALTTGTVAGESSLFLGGSFSTAGGLASYRVAQWRRPATCTDVFAPYVVWTKPWSGELVTTAQPHLQLGFVDWGTGANTSTLGFWVNGTAVAASCVFTADTADCVPTSPLPAGAISVTARLRDLAGNTSEDAVRTFSIQDLVPPTLTITSPAEGATLDSSLPALGLAYADAGAGVDTASIAVELDGQATPVECQASANNATCVPTAAIAAGTHTATVTVRDLQGNVSAPAQRNFTIASPPAPTTVVGRVVYADGRGATDSTVWIADREDLATQAAADGTFAIPEVAVSGPTLLRVAVRVYTPTGSQFGYSASVPAVPGGTTDVGTISLKAPCDSFVTASPLHSTSARLEREPYDFAAFDEGFGPTLFAGGNFNYASSRAIGRLARWTTAGWTNVSFGVSYDYLPEARALATYNDGRGTALYVGGRFSSAGEAGARYLARWNGAAFEEVGSGTNGAVTDLTVFDEGSGPELYVTGQFTRVGVRTPWTGTDSSIPADRVAKWNGHRWAPVGGGLPGPTEESDLRLAILREGATTSLFVWGPAGSAGLGLWKLVGGAWQSLTLPVGTATIASFDSGSGSAIYVAGYGVGLQKRVGSSWVSVLSGGSDAFDMVTHTDGGVPYLYAVGYFTGLAGSTGTAHLRRYDGSSWSASLGDASKVWTVDGWEAQPTLLRSQTDGTLERWTGASFVPFVASGDTDGSVTSVALVNDANGDSVLFAGPSRAAGINLGGGIARWSGSSVTAAGAGLSPGVSRVAQSFDGERLRTYGINVALGEVAEWNGSGWTLIGPPIGTTITTVAWADAGGQMRFYAGGNGVFRWNGTFWQALGGPVKVEAMASYSGQLWVGGGTSNSGPFPGAALAKWDGATWTSAGFSDAVHALTVFGGKLHVGGAFLTGYGGYGYRAFDGFSWGRGDGPPCGYWGNEYLSPTIPTPRQSAEIFALTGFDDGLTPTTVIGGRFAAACNTSSTGNVLSYRHLNFGGGVAGPAVRALASGTFAGAPAVVVGGDFAEAGGAASALLAVWSKSPSWGSCSPAGSPPVISFDAPTDGQALTSSSVVVAGHVDEVSGLTVDGVPVAVASDLRFSTAALPLHSGINRFVFRAYDRTGAMAERTLTLLRDSAAPTVQITSPASADVVLTGRPPILVTLADDLSTVDASTLVVTLDGQALSSQACVLGLDRARCQLSADLASGAHSVSATVSDRAGNTGASGAVAFVVNVGEGSGTTVVGTVIDSRGLPVPAARIRLLGRPGVEATSGADGRFSVEVADLGTTRALTVVAERSTGAGLEVGFAANLVPIVGGSTSAGSIRLGLGCDPVLNADLFGSAGVNGKVYALAVHDDGRGAALYVGGSFDYAGELPVANIARWDGATWETLGAGTDGSVRALAVWNDGSGPALYVGGGFARAGGLTVSGIARWRGGAWAGVGSGLVAHVYSAAVQTCLSIPGTIRALRVFDPGSGPALFAGGTFESIDGVPTDGVARLDASGWHGYGTRNYCQQPEGLGVMAFEAYDEGSGPRLFAAGNFAAVGGVAANSIARLVAGTWQPVDLGIGRFTYGGSSAPALVNALAVYDSGSGPELVAAGLFDAVGSAGLQAWSIARWNGQRWAELGGGLGAIYTRTDWPTGIQALATFDDGSGPELYAVGHMSGSSTSTLGSSARWNGRTWLPVGDGLREAGEGGMALAAFQGRLWVGGTLGRAGALQARGIASWGQGQWQTTGDALDGAVEAFTIFDDGTGPALYLGGRFTGAGGLALNHVARWDGSAFHPLGAGTDGNVFALRGFDDGNGPRLYVGGAFATAGGQPALSVASWGAGGWRAVGDGLTQYGGGATVYALEAHDAGSGTQLYAGGSFELSGANAMINFARLEGGAWVGMGNVFGTINALRSSNVGGTRALYLGGSISSINQLGFSNLVRYAGDSFSAVGGWTAGPVESLEVWPTATGERLLVTGWFTPALYAWDGTSWTSPGNGPSPKAKASASLREGAGWRLLTGGTTGLADWTGSSWSYDPGIIAGTSDVTALQAIEEPSASAVYVGGTMLSWSHPPRYFGRWSRPLTCTDTRPPTLWFVSPAAGAQVAARPTLEVGYSDSSSGVDRASLGFTLGGAPLVATCTDLEQGARCVPDLALPDGSRTITANLRDLLRCRLGHRWRDGRAHAVARDRQAVHYLRQHGPLHDDPAFA